VNAELRERVIDCLRSVIDPEIGSELLKEVWPDVLSSGMSKMKESQTELEPSGELL
jgi:hypothetical protein